MYNVAKIQKIDMSELENIPELKFHKNEKKSEKAQKFTGKCH